LGLQPSFRQKKGKKGKAGKKREKSQLFYTMFTVTLLAAFAVSIRSDSASITLTTMARSPFPVAPNFASFSMEISNALTFLGKAESLNLPFINLLNVLRNASGGMRGPSIRIGGNSAEFSVWWVAGPNLPANQTYAITPTDIKAYAAAFPLFDGYAVIDTSMFIQNNPEWAGAHAKGVSEYWGWARVEGVEVGNEVEIFHDSGVRPHNWTFSDYEKEFEAHVAVLESSGMPRGLIQGAVFCWYVLLNISAAVCVPTHPPHSPWLTHNFCFSPPLIVAITPITILDYLPTQSHMPVRAFSRAYPITTIQSVAATETPCIFPPC